MDPAVQAQLIDLARLTIPAVIAVAGTLGGGYFGHRYAKEQARTAKALDFVERRVREFYSPMVGCVKRIRVLSELRLEISRAGQVAWGKICDNAPKPFVNHDEEFKPFRAIIDYDNTQLYEEILPAYDRLVAVFTENYWLADDESRQYYGELCRFVELWHRFKARSLPHPVLRELDHSEQRLKPLYGLLERQLAELTAIVAHKQAA